MIIQKHGKMLCTCGSEVNGSNLKPPLVHVSTLGHGHGFFGGRAKFAEKAVCKECGEEYWAYLQQKGNSYIIIGMKEVDVTVTDEDIDTGEEIALEDMTVKGLRSFATDHNIEIPRGISRKDDIIDLIEATLTDETQDSNE